MPGTTKPNTIKFVAKKVANNGDANDYAKMPIGADSDNVDRPDGSTVEESLTNIETEKVEIIPVEILPESNIEVYPFIYALVKPNESKGILFEYRDGKWIPYGNGSEGIWVGTKEECAKDFDNIENGTIVIIVNKNGDSEDTHTHDYVCYTTKEPTYSNTGIKTYKCFLCGDSYTEEIPALSDSTKPTGIIRIGNKGYATWKDSITFDTYYKDNQTVTIEATDNETGVKEIAYYLATAGVNSSNIETVSWTSYIAPFTIEPNNNYIVYARITDNANNVTYICSDGIVMDNIPPVFNGLENGGTYPTGTVLTVEEGATLTVNGSVVELTNNSYMFTEVSDNSQLSLTDRAGNVHSITININHVHNFVNGVCDGCGISEDEFEDFTLTAYNFSQTGLKTLDGDIQVPATFEYEGKKYKINAINISDLVHKMRSISLPNTVTKIMYLYNSSLETINMSNSVKEITKLKCLKLKKIVLSSGLNKIGERCFESCESLISIGEIGSGSSVEIPNSVKSIESYAFVNCTGLITANIPEGVEFINSNAFASCDNLKTLTIPSTYNSGSNYGSISSSNSVTTLYYNSEYCSSNGTDISQACSKDGCTIYFGTNVNNLPKVLGYIKVKEVILLSNNITKIPSEFLSNQTLLSKINIPDSVTTIESDAFLCCTNLTELVIPDGVTTIGLCAFSACSNLTELIIPDSVTKIESYAFENVPHITYNGTATGAPWGALAMN